MKIAAGTAPTSLPRNATPLTGAAGISALRRLVVRWMARRRDRQALARLDTHLLRDIGLDAGRAADEAARPFWKA